VDAGGARELEEAAKGFESLLVSRLVESMRASIDEGSLLDGDAGAKQVRDMFWHFLSEEIGASGGLGLWKQLAREYQANDRAVAPSEAGGELEIER
jgi:Rod binding domain-containing protein